MFSRSIHAVTEGKIFFFMAELHSVMNMYHSYFIHLSTDGHLGCVHILMIVNDSAMFFQISVIGFFGYITGSGFAGSKGRSSFNFLR